MYIYLYASIFVAFSIVARVVFCANMWEMMRFATDFLVLFALLDFTFDKRKAEGSPQQYILSVLAVIGGFSWIYYLIG